MDRNEVIEIIARGMDAREDDHCLSSAELATAALTALESAGLAIVPVEATSAMIAAGNISDPLGCDVDDGQIPEIYRAIYRAMISAAKE